MPNITKTDALALLSTQDINEIVKPATERSVALSNFRTVRMSAGTASMPVLAALPNAGWVSQDPTNPETPTDATKPTSSVRWLNKKLVAEEIAVIVPVHENIIADSRFDLWSEVRPLVAQEFGRVLDSAILFGTNKPASWVDPALVPGAISHGNDVDATSSLADDFNTAFGYVEEDGFDVNSVFTGKFLRQQLRGLKDADNRPIYLDSVRGDGNVSSIYGQDLSYVANGAWNKATATALVGDRTKVVLGIREDMQVKLLDQATVGGIHLAERDMVALRFKFRVAYALAYSTAGNEEQAFPFATITPN